VTVCVGQLMATADEFFHDLKEAPRVKIGRRIIRYSRHHVLANEVFDNSTFMKALQSRGYWDQASFRANGVALVRTINGMIAYNSNYRKFIAGASHTGYHSAYNEYQNQIIKAFDREYRTRRKTRDWGRSLSEDAWLQNQAKKIHGYVAFLKVELRNPNSALRLHSSDKHRGDIPPREIWRNFATRMFDERTLKFDPAITKHPAYVAARRFKPGRHAGAGGIDSRPGSGSVLDPQKNPDDAAVARALQRELGIKPTTPSVFDKAHIHRTLGILKKRAGAVMLGLAVGGIFALIHQQQRTMAAVENRKVEFDEARRALGIEFDYETLLRIGGEIAFNVGVSAVLPAAWAKELWGLVLSSEDAIGLARLYARLFPDNKLLKRMNELADGIESSSAYKTYKEATDAFKARVGRMFFGEDKQPEADDEDEAEDDTPADRSRPTPQPEDDTGAPAAGEGAFTSGVKSAPVAGDTEAPSSLNSDGRRNDDTVSPTKAPEGVSGPASLLQPGSESASDSIPMEPAVRVDADPLPEGEGSSAPFPERATPSNDSMDTGRSAPDRVGMFPARSAAIAPEVPAGVPLSPFAPRGEAQVDFERTQAYLDELIAIRWRAFEHAGASGRIPGTPWSLDDSDLSQDQAYRIFSDYPGSGLG
jgi:hypothetical protein